MTRAGTTEELLRKTQLFGLLGEAALRGVAGYCRSRTFKAGTDLFHEGDLSQTLFVIASGHINIQQMRGEETIHIARRGPGEVIGELAVLDAQPRFADAVTDTDCHVLMLDRIDIKRFLLEHPQASWQLIKVLSARLREASDRLVQFETTDALGKVARVVHSAVKEGAADDKGRICLQNFSDEKIAERAGVTRETVNRRIARLRKAGVVHREGRTLVILNQDKLRQMAEK